MGRSSRSNLFHLTLLSKQIRLDILSLRSEPSHRVRFIQRSIHPRRSKAKGVLNKSSPPRQRPIFGLCQFTAIGCRSDAIAARLFPFSKKLRGTTFDAPNANRLGVCPRPSLKPKSRCRTSKSRKFHKKARNPRGKRRIGSR